MTAKAYPANVVHSDSYYGACILIFIDGLTNNLSHAQIAARLNAADLKTPQGFEWSAESLKQCLKRVRLHRDYRSSFHSALLRLVYAGELTVQQTQILFAHRTSGGY